jgi:hypothetical protein
MPVDLFDIRIRSDQQPPTETEKELPDATT